jgi:hypothetical protein
MHLIKPSEWLSVRGRKARKIKKEKSNKMRMKEER